MREALPTHAEFVAEMARQVVFDAYGDEAYTRGLTVWTTIRKADQDAAYAAVRRGVFDYDRRHGYRGPEAFVSLPDDPAEQDAGARQGVRRRRPTATTCIAAVVLRGVADRGQGGARERRHGRRSPATASSSPRARWPTRRRRRSASAAARSSASTRDDKGTLGDRAVAAGRGGVRRGRAAATARSWRWSAASTSTATSSTT